MNRSDYASLKSGIPVYIKANLSPHLHGTTVTWGPELFLVLLMSSNGNLLWTGLYWSVVYIKCVTFTRICHVAAVYLIILNIDLSALQYITLMFALPLCWHAERRRNFVRIPLFKLLQRLKATLPLRCAYVTSYGISVRSQGWTKGYCECKAV